MKADQFQEKVAGVQQRIKSRPYGFEGPLVFGRSQVAFFTLVVPEGQTYRETVYVVWLNENGNLQLEEIMSLIGFFKTSLAVRIENNYALLNVRCEGDSSHEFDFQIPLNIIREWCGKPDRPNKIVIIN